MYNNLQAAEFGTNNSNTNSVGLLPAIVGLEPQSANQMAARQPGGQAFRGPTNANFPNTTNPVVLIGGDLGSAAARMGYPKGCGFLIASNSNGTSAVTFDLTNTQVNTNSYWGDTSFTNANIIILHNLSGIDGVSNGNGSWFVNIGHQRRGFEPQHERLHLRCEAERRRGDDQRPERIRHCGGNLQGAVHAGQRWRARRGGLRVLTRKERSMENRGTGPDPEPPLPPSGSGSQST